MTLQRGTVVINHSAAGVDEMGIVSSLKSILGCEFCYGGIVVRIVWSLWREFIFLLIDIYDLQVIICGQLMIEFSRFTLPVRCRSDVQRSRDRDVVNR
jgi:hypothetical protein